MDHESVADIPPYVPARMVNEFVYCPRFFHLAWSSGETGENDYTIEGKWQHRQVDRPIGDPAVGDGGGTPRSTSVLVSSRRLGVIAKVDIIESRNGSVVPVELKRGSERNVEHPLWEPERVQLAVIALVLRDCGYSVPYTEVRFTGSSKPIRVELTDDLITRTKAVLQQLRLVAAEPLPPPPLIDSPKCPACIMNPACLPDEHNFVNRRAENAPRRLVPNETAASPLYVTEQGSRIGVTGQQLAIKKDRVTLSNIRLIDVSQVSIFGNVHEVSPP